jgi:formylglycine-generating enzyme required for sulfatase activity
MDGSFLMLAIALFALAQSQRAPVAQPLELEGGCGTASRAMVHIQAGNFRPFYAPSAAESVVPVSAFCIDEVAVTNGDFARFVAKHPKWRRDRVSRLFADEGYLRHWTSAETLGDEVRPAQPVTGVSWFAAKAYCEARAARLPTELEWEYVAAASERAPDARSDLEWRATILEWYSRPSGGALSDVGRTKKNYWGVRDMHGLIWEWVLDFNSILVSGDSRETRQTDKQKFCGAGALGASESKDYASFMRIAFRGSLGAEYTTKTLGFRCAKDVVTHGKTID